MSKYLKSKAALLQPNELKVNIQLDYIIIIIIFI